jgi:hypothetical protein
MALAWPWRLSLSLSVIKRFENIKLTRKNLTPVSNYDIRSSKTKITINLPDIPQAMAEHDTDDLTIHRNFRFLMDFAREKCELQSK